MAKSTITIQLDDLDEMLTNGIQTILHDNIDSFKKCVADEVEKSVYPFYSPKGYRRRESNGGLSDPNNYEVVEGPLSLTLTNRTRSNPDYWKYTYSIPITDVVENGNGDGWVGVPERPFMDKALEKFANDVIIPQIEAMLGGR